MSGYSATPLAKKLGIRAHARLYVRRAMRADAAIWVSWPKKASGVDSDISENAVQR
jgi:hypothetical protein